MITSAKTHIERYISIEQLETVFLGNTIFDYLTTFVLFIVLLILFKIFQIIIITRLNLLAKKTRTEIDDTLIKVIKSLRPPFYFFVAFYIVVQNLFLGEIFKKALSVVLVIWIVYHIVIALQILINYFVRKRMEDEAGGHADATISLLSLISKIVIWSLGFLFALSNLGINVTSLIAAMGVGGIAIAFALQNILSDLFSSFAIYFDKPFVPGDFIVIGNNSGVVQKIGIKTTRIKTLQGEELVVSNKEITSVRIQNFKKLEERRVVLSLGVTYDTKTEMLKKIPAIIKNLIDNTNKARHDRTHFRSFGNSALEIEIVYYATTSDYNEYMDINQEVLLKIKNLFEKEEINFAFPTQTIHIEK